MIDKEHTIAIYGLSRSTQELLEQLGEQYNIIGLLDGYRQDGMLYRKPIISLSQAIKIGVTAIIVVARPSSRRIIVNRIREDCVEHNIKLYDMYGNDLMEPVSANGLLNVATDIGREEIKKKIDESEVVSFDIFDTLVTRTVLCPTDVFELVERKLVTKYGNGFDFCERRQEVELELSRNGVPAIGEIYEELGKRLDLDAIILQEIEELEWQTEHQVLVPRYDMCEMFQYALKKYKKVYLVSDMYYPAGQMISLLEKLGITGYEKLIVSCDYRTTKERDLFRILKDEANADKYVHIGDNYSADIRSAEKNGISGIWVKSGMELFDSLYWSEEFAQCSGLAERVKLGMFIARMFNSPFVFEKGTVSISNPADLGYLCFAPILTDFALWLHEAVQKTQGVYILFAARDGYLLKDMFERLANIVSVSDCMAKSIYFLTSRISAVSASIYNEQDILQVAAKEFNGSLRKLLKTRFSLREEELALVSEESGVEEILQYSGLILNRAKENRENYLKYISSLGLSDKETVFFDFVSSGTSQVALEKLMNRKMQGYYFIQVADDSPEKKGLSITPFYDGENDGQGIYEDYFILENILTSPMPSLRGFDAEGKPEYLEEIRSKEQIAFVEQVHEGIVQYFEHYLELMQGASECVSRECSAKLLGLLHKVSIDNDIFHNMVWDDSFYARTIAMKELM